MSRGLTPADWSKRGIVFYGGSRDGQLLDLFPTGASFNLSHTIAGQGIVELYGRTGHAKDGRTIFRYAERRADLKD